jgi:hypothetical protein
MKKLLFVLLVLVFVAGTYQANAQFKDAVSEEQPSVTSSFIHPAASSALFGFFNPDSLHMNQSYSMSYSAIGGQGIALGRFTNSMLYRISNSLDVQADVSLQHSPYNTLDKSFQSGLNGIFLDRAEINYRPTQNMLFQISYRQVPYNDFGFYSPNYYRGLFGEGY